MTADYRTAAGPTVHPSAWIAPTADVIGDVTLGPNSSVWHQCVLRGDIAPIRIGEDTNVQDLTMVHVDVDRPCHVGDRVGIGHRAIIHGCDIEDDCLIGMGAIVLSNAVVGAGSVIAAGAVVLEGVRVPSNSLVAGVPGRVVRSVDAELRRRARLTVDHYRELKEGHRAGRWVGSRGHRRKPPKA
jgi:carbonic anhydrase/acetyltransferase-like protein (isoleucine patch superfamily)